MFSHPHATCKAMKSVDSMQPFITDRKINDEQKKINQTGHDIFNVGKLVQEGRENHGRQPANLHYKRVRLEHWELQLAAYPKSAASTRPKQLPN